MLLLTVKKIALNDIRTIMKNDGHKLTLRQWAHTYATRGFEFGLAMGLASKD